MENHENRSRVIEKDNIELMIFPFIQDVSKLCDVYINNPSMDAAQYYLVHVTLSQTLQLALDNCSLRFDSNFYNLSAAASWQHWLELA